MAAWAKAVDNANIVSAKTLVSKWKIYGGNEAVKYTCPIPLVLNPWIVIR